VTARRKSEMDGTRERTGSIGKRGRSERKSVTDRPQTDRKSTSERSWAIWSDRGRSRDGDGRAQERPRAPKSGPRRARDGPRPPPGVPRRAGERPKRRPNRSPAAPVGVPKGIPSPQLVRSASVTIFQRFCRVARTAGCAKNVAPAIVLYTSHEVRTERARAAQKHRNTAVSPSKTLRNRPKTHRIRARTAKTSAKSALNPKFLRK